MNEQVTKEMLERLDLLAAKLGATGEHLWSVLVRQGYIVGYEALFYLITSIISAVYVSKNVTRWWNKATENDAEPVFITIALVYLVVFLMFFACGIGYTTVIFNPEYYALNKILGGN